MKDAEYQAIAHSIDVGNVWWADDCDMLEFANRIRNAALEEAAVRCIEAEEYLGRLDAIQYAEQIRKMKS